MIEELIKFFFGNCYANTINLIIMIIQICLLSFGIWKISAQKNEKDNIKISNLIANIKDTYTYIQAWSTYIFTTDAPRNITSNPDKIFDNYYNHKNLLTNYKPSRDWENTKSLLIIRLSKQKKSLLHKEYNHHEIKDIIIAINTLYEFADTLFNINNRINELADNHNIKYGNDNGKFVFFKKSKKYEQNEHQYNHTSSFIEDKVIKDLWASAYNQIENYRKNSNDKKEDEILKTINKILPKDLRYE